MNSTILITDSPCTVHFQVESITNAIPLPPTDQYQDIVPQITYVAQTTSVTVPAPGSAAYGSTFPVAATTNSGQTVSIAVSGGCSTSSPTSPATITMTSGTTACTITYSAGLIGPYAAATNVVSTVTAVKANQTVAFTSSAPASPVVDQTYTPTATATSTLPATLSIDASTSANCSISGGVVTFNAVGNCTINANQIGDSNYSAAAQVQQTIAVTARRFDAVEQGKAWGTHLYTKLAGQSFNVDVLVGNSAGSLATKYIGTLKLELIDYSSGSCGSVGDGQTLSTTTYTYTSGDAGRHTFTISYANAVKVAAFRISDSTGKSTTGCSTDSFSIRPAGLLLSASPASGSTLTAGGGTFTLTALAINNSGSTIGSGYSGTTPSLDTTKVTDWTSAAIPAGATGWSGSFNSATCGGSGCASTATVSYGDIGPLSVPATSPSTTPTLVAYDGSFTAGDQASDCVAGSTSNTADGNGKFGCIVGSWASGGGALTTPRFIPHHYVMTMAFTPATACGFTYMGQKLGMNLSVNAMNGAATSQVMTRWASSGAPPTWLPLIQSVVASDPSVTPGNLNASFAGGTPAFPSTITWSGGTFSYAPNPAPTFTRPASPADYEQLTLTVTVKDQDGVTFGTSPTTYCWDGAGHFGTVTNNAGAQTTSCQSPTQGAAIVRYGMLQLENVYGSDLLPLYVPLNAIYWDRTRNAWSVNTLDSCTQIEIAGATPNLAIGNYKGNLSGHTSVFTASPLTLSLDSAKIGFTAPGAGFVGSADVTINLGTGANNACVSGLASSGANLAHLLGNWCASTYSKDPAARISFGIAKVPFLYRREKY